MAQSCGAPPVIDGRHERVDFALTLGEPWATQVCATDQNTGSPFDLTGAVVEAGLFDAAGVEVFGLSPVVDLATGCVTLSVSGADTEDEPLGLGSWSWYLRVRLPGDAEPSYWVGGSWSIYRVDSYAVSGGACGPGVVDVCVGSEVLLAVNACAGTQGPAGGQAHVGPLPPANLAAGMLWVMTPIDHVAVYTASGWKPVWPQTDNQAVTTGGAFAGVDGLWVASDGVPTP